MRLSLIMQVIILCVYKYRYIRDVNLINKCVYIQKEKIIIKKEKRNDEKKYLKIFKKKGKKKKVVKCMLIVLYYCLCYVCVM